MSQNALPVHSQGDIAHRTFQEASHPLRVVCMSSPTRGATVTDLFTSYQLGSLELANRLVMAPLTRNRAGAGEAPTELAAEYYAQRARPGLSISEGTQPCAIGQGYPHTPGLH